MLNQSWYSSLGTRSSTVTQCRGMCGVCNVTRALILGVKAGHKSETCLALNCGSSAELIRTAGCFVSRAVNIAQ